MKMPPEQMIEIGKRVVAAREALGLTPKQLADAAGCSVKHVYNIEAGTRALTKHRVRESIEDHAGRKLRDETGDARDYDPARHKTVKDFE